MGGKWWVFVVAEAEQAPVCRASPSLATSDYAQAQSLLVRNRLEVSDLHKYRSDYDYVQKCFYFACMHHRVCWYHDSVFTLWTIIKGCLMAT
jgi:hypothetical protein